MKSLLLAGLCLASAYRAQAAVRFQPFHHFFGTTGNVNGQAFPQPNPPLIQATDGNLYGTVDVGGMYGYGFIFRVTTNGGFTIVYSFSGGSDGGTPQAALLQAADGNLYGTTADGGPNHAGTVFRITTNGVLTTLYSFTGGADVGMPATALVQTSDGNLYGAAAGGLAPGALFRITTNGALTTIHSNFYKDYGVTTLTIGRDGNLYGTVFDSEVDYAYGEVFRLGTNGNYQTLYTFPGDTPNGLAQASDGNFYGTTGGGVFFRINTNGMLTNLYMFPGSPYSPDSQLVLASDGILYGTASGYSGGEVFRLTTNGVETEVCQFTAGFDGAWVSALVQASDGYLYGTTDSGAAGNRGTVFRIGTNGVITVLAAFPSANAGDFPDGAFPDAGLAQASDGNLYGSVDAGGLDGYGVVFRLGTNGSFTVLYSFTNGPDGADPSALIQASDGNLYGTTPTSGPSEKGGIFRVTTNGALTPLYSFTGPSDGAIPLQGLIEANDSRFYGTASSGGTSNNGTIFEFTTNAVFTLVYRFTNGFDGADPVGLAQAGDGNLYGLANSGGAGSNGTIFQITPNGTFSLLHSFTGGDDGAEPSGPSLLATNGYLYGTTLSGGAAPGKAGTVFRITTGGVLSTLYSFTGGIDGGNPTGLAFGSDGNLYGTTKAGGSLYGGTLFQISTNGTFSVIHSFYEGGSDGALPLSSLLSASDGNIYGTTQIGGSDILGGFGTIFRVVITSSNAPLPSLQFPTLSAGNLSFGFQAAAGQSYFIQQATNIATTNWTFYTNLVGAGSLFQLSVPATSAAQFFRLREP